MAIEIAVPQVGEAVAEVILAAWLKEEGDHVERGECLFEVDTDKAIVEVEAFADGTLAKILVPAGTAVMPQDVVGLLEPTDDAFRPLSRTPETYAASAAADTAQPSAPPTGTSARRDKASEGPSAPTRPAGRRRPQVSLRARRLAKQLGVDVSTLSGTGVDGLITVSDVEAAAQDAGAPEAAPVLRPLPRLRRAIATHMQTSKQTVPHFYLMADVDMTSVQRLRQHCGETLGWERVPTYTDAIVHACALALAAMPEVNVIYTDQGLLVRPTIDVGIAVGTAEGLRVTVLPSADRLSLRETSQQIRELAERARQGRMRSRNLSEKSMVVTNLGMYDVDVFVAIIDVPDPVILAVGRVADRVVAVDGEPAVRPMCTLTLSVDHRGLDGVLGAQFLAQIKMHLENAMQFVEADQ